MEYVWGGMLIAFVFAVVMLIRSFFEEEDERPPIPPRQRPDAADAIGQAKTEDEMREIIAKECLKSGKIMMGNMKPDGSWEVTEMDSPKL